MVYNIIKSKRLDDSTKIYILQENPREVYHTVYVRFGKKALASDELKSLKDADTLARKVENSRLTRIFSLSKRRAYKLRLSELIWAQ